MIRVIFGEDNFSVEERVRGIAESIGQPEVRDPNTSVFEGDSYSKDEMLGAASAVPFLADRRLVLVRGLLGRLDGGTRRRGRSAGRTPKGDWTQLADELAALPPTTELVFVDGPLRHNGVGLRSAGPQAQAERFPAKRGVELERWINERFTAQAARPSPGAVSRLAELVGGDLRTLDQEIRKLALYAVDRPVEARDVNLMVSRAGETNVFAAVDAVLERRTAVAVRLMHQLREEGASVQHLLFMLARQVRAALLVQELSGNGLPGEEIARRTGLNPGYPLRKTLEQSRRFPFEYLADVHRRLLAADLAFKSGTDERLGVELLVARLSSSR